ncbi:diguanylate cyclase (GGDEF)-like protein [Paraburkholderia unamae]|uniref:diguanylate cyclase n=1 Tax=Paraburkholderia unamae TaxID=219649 RepID=A0ABX5KJI2_9BURK|nr:diguanylate cyclase (GGDEF)-like protein [Paraburkholderia unamae]
MRRANSQRYSIVVVAGMPHARRTGLPGTHSRFEDDEERKLFWESAAQSSRHLAVAVQLFGLVAWLMSRALANPNARFSTPDTLIAVGGMLASMGITYASRGRRMDGFGRFACAAFTALAFHSNLPGTQHPAFWVLPMGIVIIVGMAPVFSGSCNYVASALVVWLIISRGAVSELLNAPERNWIALFALSGLALGLLLNVLFVQERKKTFLVQRELARLAYRDALTEIPNRRSFMLAIDECRGRPSAAEYWLLLIDVDDFKQINDTSGHDVGDQVLIAAAQAIAHCATPHVCGRLGGEEFGVIYSGDRQGAYTLAHRIRDAVASECRSGHTVTVSIGIARIARQIGVPETFRLADRGLYEAKRQGKNRCVLVKP